MNGRNHKIAVLYNEDGQISRGDPQDLLAVQCTITATQNIYEALTSLGYQVVKVAVRGNLDDLEDILCSFSPKDTFIFNNCDGFNGNNMGAVEIVRLIERMGFKHTGATADSIELCIDKPRAKELLIRSGVPTPKFQVFEKPIGKLEIGFPVIVKPSVEDASMGIDLSSVACNEADVFKRIAYILNEYEQPAMVEQFISGRELAVAMWGNKVPQILPIAEDDFSAIANPLEHVLTYESKWRPESPFFQNIPSCIPAKLTRKEEQCIYKAAASTFQVVGLRDLGRVDIRFAKGIPYIIDINEIPDLSPDAGFWNSAHAAGWSYPNMIEEILKLAMRREGWME